MDHAASVGPHRPRLPKPTTRKSYAERMSSRSFGEPQALPSATDDQTGRPSTHRQWTRTTNPPNPASNADRVTRLRRGVDPGAFGPGQIARSRTVTNKAGALQPISTSAADQSTETPSRNGRSVPTAGIRAVGPELPEWSTAHRSRAVRRSLSVEGSEEDIRPPPSAGRRRLALAFSAVTIALAFGGALGGLYIARPKDDLGVAEARQALTVFVSAAAAGDVGAMNEAVSDSSTLKDNEAALTDISSRLQSAIVGGSTPPSRTEVSSIDLEVWASGDTQTIVLTGFVSASGNRLPYRAELTAERGSWKVVAVELP